MEAEFRNKGVLVTGTTGIGRACALRFAAGGAGVVAIGIDPKGNAALADEAQKHGFLLEVIEADATDEAAVSKATAHCVSAFGGLDIIVNAAAIHPYGTVVTTSAETFARCMAVNVGSIHITAKCGIPEMQKRGGGAIINISSVQGHACQQNVAAYVASKGAIHALTRAMALDHAAQKITVNSISPGSVRTPILELAARTFDGPDANIDAVFARFGAAHPIGRIGEPEEIAELAAFLASAKGGFITGSDMLIDGGLKAGLGVK